MQMCKRNHKIYLWVLIVVLQFNWFTPAVGAFKHIREGMTAPNIKGVDIITGQEISLKSFLENKYVIVFFWATWSPRSMLQLEEAKALIENYGSDSIQIIAVNVEQPNLNSKQISEIEKTVKEMDLPFPVIIDKGLEIFYTYGVIAVPSTAIIDNSGILRYAPSGYSLATRDIIVDSVESYLGLFKEDSIVIKKGYTPEIAASRYYGMALKLYTKELYDRSLSALDAAKLKDTNFASPFTLEGDIYLNLNEYPKAINAFSKALELDSNSIAAWSGLGQAYLLSNNLDSAKNILAFAIELDKTYVPALIDYGVILSKTGELQAGLDSFRVAIELNPQNVLAYFYSARIYQEMGMKDKALEFYLTVLELLYPEK